MSDINGIKSKYDSNLYLITRVFSEHIRAQLRQIMFVVLCMLIIAFSTALNAWLMKPVLDEIFVKHNHSMLYIIPLAVLINTVIKGVASFFQTSTLKLIGQKIVAEIQLRLYAHIIYSDMRVLLEYPSGNLISRFTNDINAMRKSVSDVLTGLVMEFCTLTGLLAVMFYQSFNLTMISIFVFPLSFYPMMRLGKRMRKVARGMQEELGDFTVHLDETFQNIRIIKSYCREKYEISRARHIIIRFLELYRKAGFIESASSPIMEGMGGIAVALVVWYGGMQVIEGQTTPGAFFSFIAALLMAYKPLKTISQLNTSMQEGLAASRRLFIMIDETPKILDNPKLADTTFSSYNIEFRNVYFSYKSEQRILDGLNLLIPHGQTVALVGTSGGGKTTILNLIERLYDPNYGSVTIDGQDIKDVRLQSLRNSIALVSQEIALFDDTISENIRYGRLDANDEEIVDAALAAAAHDFIVSLPDGYDTHIGQHGVKLSGGQRQRIAIARAILKNAPVLLLDEATSALDSISEKQVQMALEYLKKGRTTIVIAHRLSTIEAADLIYVIMEGKAIESGSHQELMMLGGEYSRLYEQYKSNMVS